MACRESGGLLVFRPTQTRKEPQVLCLTRRIGERILIGKDVVIEVRGVEQGRVRIGVIAPRDTTVLREELVAPKPAVAEKP